MTTVGVAHRYFLYLSPIIVQASPSYNLLKPLSLSGGRKLAVTGLATFMEQNMEGMQAQLADKGISGRYAILSIPLPDVIMSRDQTSYRSDIPAEARSPIYKFRFINRGGWVYRGCDAWTVAGMIIVEISSNGGSRQRG